MVEIEDVKTAYENGEISEYFYTQIIKKIPYFSADQLDVYFHEAKDMSKLGIQDANSQKEFFYILTYASDFLKEVVDGRVDSTQLPQIVADIYTNKDRFPVDTPLNALLAVSRSAYSLGLPVKTHLVKELEELALQGKDENNVLNIGPVLAYPQNWVGDTAAPAYDVSKWMKATRDIYSRAQKLGSLDAAFTEVTKNWDKMESQDYKYWLRFYQEGIHNKYKTAQMRIYEGNSGYILPNPIDNNDLRSALPSPISMPDIPSSPKSDENDVRDRIEQQRARILSRLNAAEKLLCSLDGQTFAGDDQEYMLKILQDLKRKVQTANKISIRSSLFEDYIYRTANFLSNSGKIRPAAFFYKVAQAEELDTGGGPGAPPPPGKDPTEDLLGGGDVGSELPSEGDLDISAPMGGSDAKEATRGVFREFFSRLETGISDIEDENNKEDDLQLDDAFISVTAQEIPSGEISAIPPEESPPADEMPRPGREPKPKEPEADIEVAEKPEPTEHHEPHGNTEDIIESALDNISVEDVIERLEVLSSIFKKREVARQLSIVDLMLDKLGIGAFFPGLGEAERSALESNQYISTRVEDILAKLRGTVTEGPDLTTQEENPETAGLRSQLEQKEKDEEAKKEQRRQRREQRETAPPGGVGAAAPEELAAPARIEPSRPLPVR